MGAAVDSAIISAAILQPTFDAVRDIFVEFHRRHGGLADKLKKTRLRVDPAVHDAPRHFMMTRDDGSEVLAAPQAADLALGTLTAITCHEFGHVADFDHPGRWLFVSQQEPAIWLPDDLPDKKRVKLERQWLERSDDEIEWTADAIAYAVTGKRIGYCGRCVVQCLSGGMPRPRGLR